MFLNIYRLWIYGIFIACTGLVIFCIQPSMDMFSSYHALACHYFPNAVLNSFREPCDGQLDLILFGGLHIPRSYPYIGSLEAWYYYPFYLFYPHPLSAYLSKLLLLIVTTIGAHRLLKCRYDVLLPLLTLNFFVMFNIIQDQGTIAIQTAAIFWIPIMVQKALRTDSAWHGMVWGTVAGLLAFMCLESKPVFVYTLLGILIIVLTVSTLQLSPIKENWKKLLRFVPGLFLFSALTTLLLFARDMAGNYYIDLLRGLSNPLQFLSADHWQALRAIWNQYWSQFGSAANFSYHYFRPPTKLFNLVTTDYDVTASLLFWMAMAMFSGLYLSKIRSTLSKDKQNTYLYLAFIAAGVAVSLWISTSRSLNNPHHHVQSLVLFCAEFAICAEWCWKRYPIFTKSLLMLTSASQLAIAGYLSLIEPEQRASRDISTVHNLLYNEQIAGKTLTICTGWGAYYIYSLYGPKNQAVLFIAPFTWNHVDQVKKLAQLTGRTPLIVTGPTVEGDINYSRAFENITQVYPLNGQPSDITIWTTPTIWGLRQE